MVQATASEPSLKMRSPWFSNGCPLSKDREKLGAAANKARTCRSVAAFQRPVERSHCKLEQAVTAWQVDALTRQLRQQAKQEARALVGSLATFGLTKGSCLAHEIEHEYELRASR